MDINKILNSAQNHLNSGRLNEARNNFLKALKKLPTNIDILNILASIELQLNNKNKALVFLKNSTSIRPDQPLMLSNMAICQIELGEFKSAIESMEMAIKLLPTNATFYFNKAKAHAELQDFENAKKNYLKAIELEPKFEKAYLNIGFLFNQNNQYDDAIKYYKKLIAINPNSSQAYYNLAIAYDNMRDYENAKDLYIKTISLDENNLIARFNLSTILLYQEDYERGWSEFEFRWRNREKPSFCQKIPECINLTNIKNLLIWGEQGVGDQIIYSSMLGSIDLNKDLTIALDERLIPIYKRSFPKFNFISLHDNINEIDFEAQLAIGSLGKFLRNSKESFESQPFSFLKADLKKTNEFKRRISKKDKLICGISWKSKNEKIGHYKSLNLENLLPLLKETNIEFINLQYGDTEDERNQFFEKNGIEIKNLNGLDKFNDLDGMFALVDACDFIVTSSNVTAHIAGSLGKKTFLLVPTYLTSIWYWGSGNKCNWYPNIEILNSLDNLQSKII